MVNKNEYFQSVNVTNEPMDDLLKNGLPFEYLARTDDFNRIFERIFKFINDGATMKDIVEGFGETYDENDPLQLRRVVTNFKNDLDDQLDNIETELSNRYTKTESDGKYLSSSGKAPDADKLDGHDSTYFATKTSVDGKENAFSKNSAFNKNFGTGSTDVAAGNHTHPAGSSDAQTLQGHSASYFATASSVSGKENTLGNPSTDGQVLSSTTGGARSWITPSGGGASQLSDLSNVSVIFENEGDVLYYNGTAWTNKAPLATFYGHRNSSSESFFHEEQFEVADAGVARISDESVFELVEDDGDGIYNVKVLQNGFYKINLSAYLVADINEQVTLALVNRTNSNAVLTQIASTNSSLDSVSGVSVTTATVRYIGANSVLVLQAFCDQNPGRSTDNIMSIITNNSLSSVIIEQMA